MSDIPVESQKEILKSYVPGWIRKGMLAKRKKTKCSGNKLINSKF